MKYAKSLRTKSGGKNMCDFEKKKPFHSCRNLCKSLGVLATKPLWSLVTQLQVMGHFALMPPPTPPTPRFTNSNLIYALDCVAFRLFREVDIRTSDPVLMRTVSDCSKPHFARVATASETRDTRCSHSGGGFYLDGRAVTCFLVDPKYYIITSSMARWHVPSH
jgi:hypothetical protein